MNRWNGKKAIYLPVLLIFLYAIHICTYAEGHDANWKMWHGDQDALILGTVSRIDTETITLEVEKRLRPKGIINDVNRQLPDEEIDDILQIERFDSYQTSYHGKTKPESGDVIIVSLDAGDTCWKVNWPPFEVSGSDHNSLEFLSSFDETPESFAWATFVRTDGQINDFTITRCEDGSQSVTAKGVLSGKTIDEEIYRSTEPVSITVNAQWKWKGSIGSVIIFLLLIVGVVMIIVGLLL